MNSSRLSGKGGRTTIIGKLLCLLFALLISPYLAAEVPVVQPKVNTTGETAPKSGLMLSIDPPLSPWKTGASLTAALRAPLRAAVAKSFSIPASPDIRKFSPIPAMQGRSFA